MLQYKDMTIVCSQPECRSCAAQGCRSGYQPGQSQAGRVMLVGEVPAARRMPWASPLWGLPGNFWTRFWRRRLPMEDAHNNVVKCRPPGNRLPGRQRSAVCLAERQIELVSPNSTSAWGPGGRPSSARLRRQDRGRWSALGYEYRHLPPGSPAPGSQVKAAGGRFWSFGITTSGCSGGISLLTYLGAAGDSRTGNIGYLCGYQIPAAPG